MEYFLIYECTDKWESDSVIGIIIAEDEEHCWDQLLSFVKNDREYIFKGYSETIGRYQFNPKPHIQARSTTQTGSYPSGNGLWVEIYPVKATII